MTTLNKILVMIVGFELIYESVASRIVFLFFAGLMILLIVGLEQPIKSEEEKLKEKYQELQDAAVEDVQNLLELQRLFVTVLCDYPDADFKARVTSLLVDESPQQADDCSSLEDFIRWHELGTQRRAEAKRLIEEYIAAHSSGDGTGEVRCA